MIEHGQHLIIVFHDTTTILDFVLNVSAYAAVLLLSHIIF